MNTCAVPLTNYSTTFLYCKKAEIQGTDRKRKKILIIHKEVHPRSEEERIKQRGKTPI